LQASRPAAKEKLQALLEHHYPDVGRPVEEDDEWIAPDVRQGSLLPGSHLDTMLLDYSKKMPMSKASRFGDDVRQTDNLATLNELDDAAIVAHLDTRYSQDVIYTSIGEILLACNPFKACDIYTPKFQEMYLIGSPVIDVMPHIYKIAQNAFKALKYS